MTFREQWLAAVGAKNSVLCAGLDPADYEMRRECEGLQEGVVKRDWALAYVKAVAPYCAAVKPNTNYWKGEEDAETLKVIKDLADTLGLAVIEDSKLADIGSTNDAGIFYAARRAHAVTFSPFAGNIREAAERAHARNIGIISMCLMSNPEFAREKNKLVSVNPGDYDAADMLQDNTGVSYVRQYIQLAHDASVHGMDGIVIGAPSNKNHIRKDEIERTRRYSRADMLVLLPGVGKQTGEADPIWQYFGPENVIVNVGRALMFPTDSRWPEAARYYMEMFNKGRRG